MSMIAANTTQGHLPGLYAGGVPQSADVNRSGRVLVFTLRCLPTAQQRPRHMTTPDGFHRTYKSDAQEANERALEALLCPHKPSSPMNGGLELSFRAIYPAPKSCSKKERADMLRGAVCHTVKPDLDNLAKQIKDAMTRLQFWHDDRQVVRLICEKRYGEYPAWEVSVRRIGQGRGKHGAS